MTKKTVDELPTIGDTQKPDALAIVQQDGVTFSGLQRQNSPTRINITSQDQLEAQFGVDIEIPDTESWEISVDASFFLSKPIKLGLDSAIRITGGTSSITITYTGTGAMFQNTNPANAIDSFDMRQIAISGSTFNNAFDLIGTTNSFFFINTVQIIAFADIGTVDMDLVEIQSLGMFFNDQGFKIIDPGAFSANVVVFDQVGKGDTGATAISFIQANTTLAILDDVRGRGLSAGENIVYFDRNAPTGSAFVITNATQDAGNLFQQGGTIAITGVTDGGPNAIFTTAIAHGYVLGQVVDIEDFVVGANTNYNGTFAITAVDTTTTFETGVAFNTSEPGAVFARSLDSTDVLVSAFNNPGQPDSMSHAEARTSGTLVVAGAQNVDVPVIDVTPVAGDWIADANTERFSIDTTTGIITYNGTEKKIFDIEYQLTAAHPTGGAQTLLFDIHVAGIQQTKSQITIITSSAGVVETYIGGLFELSPGDTVQLFRDNTTNSNDTDVSVATILITAT